MTLATVNVWAPLGKTVTLAGGGVVTSAGVSVLYTDEIARLLAISILLSYDPTGINPNPSPLPSDPDGGGGGLWVDVRDYGAVGDGVTDDTLALQSAIDACWASVHGSTRKADYRTGDPVHPVQTVTVTPNIGGTVYLPPGVYIVSAQSSSHTLRLRNYVTIQGDGETSCIQAALGQPQFGRIFVSTPAEVLKSAGIKRIRVNGREKEQPGNTTPDNPQRQAIFIYGSEDFRVEDCIFEDTNDAMRLFAGPTTTRAMVLRNIVRNCEHDIGREIIQMEGAFDSIIADNQIHNCPFANGIKMEGAAHSTLFNNVVRNNIIVNCNGGVLVGGGVLVDGNRIETSNIEGAAASINGPNVTFVNNTLVGGYGTGLSVLYNVDNIIIANNTISGVIVPPSDTYCYGITVEPRDGLVPKGVTIVDNDITGSDTMLGAIRFLHCTGQMNISRNRIVGCRWGIQFETNIVSSDVTVDGNNIAVSAAGGKGITMFANYVGASLSRMYIRGNVVSLVGGVGSVTGCEISAQVDYAIISGNDFSRCGSPLVGDGAITNKAVGGNL